MLNCLPLTHEATLRVTVMVRTNCSPHMTAPVKRISSNSKPFITAGPNSPEYRIRSSALRLLCVIPLSGFWRTASLWRRTGDAHCCRMNAHVGIRWHHSEDQPMLLNLKEGERERGEFGFEIYLTILCPWLKMFWFLTVILFLLVFTFHRIQRLKTLYHSCTEGKKRYQFNFNFKNSIMYWQGHGGTQNRGWVV